MLKELAAAVPSKSMTGLLARVGGAAAVLAPGVGLAPRFIDRLAEVGMIPKGPADGVVISMGVLLSMFYGAKAMELMKSTPKPGIWIGDMFIPETAFWTGIMITGRPGSGKTSGAIMPTVEQVFRLFNGPDYIEKVVDGVAVQEENDYARCGGLVLEVKGEFYESIAYIMDQCGRNAIDDFVVLRADSNIPVAVFQDPETGHRFFLNGMHCSSGSEAGILLVATETAAGVPKESRIPPNVFAAEDSEFRQHVQRLRDLEFDVSSREVLYLGWREEGGSLVRIKRNTARGEVEHEKNTVGELIKVAKPKKLKFVDRMVVNNGYRYNLVDRKVGATEAAEKLVLMASMAGRGEGKGGDNSYWNSNAQKQIQGVISLLRTIHPDREVTCADINKCISSDKEMDIGLKELNKKLIALGQTINLEQDPDKKRYLERHQLTPLKAVETLLKEEWIPLDDKTKGIIRTVITNVFSNFVLDPALFETFCSPSTFSFDDCSQKGKVFCVVPGEKYEAMAKVLGTGFKVDWQRSCLSRLSRSEMNQRRAQIQLTDECWNWVISGGSSGGDEKFLSLCRQPRIFNILATQSFQQFITELKRDSAKTYLGQFGVFVWLQNFDEETNRMAAELMEEVKREEHETTHENVGIADIAAGKSASARVNTKWKKETLYTTQDFRQLALDEAIVFNGYRSKDQALKTKMPKSQITHPSEKPKIARFMRTYLRGVLENALHRENRVDRLNHTVSRTNAPAVTAPPPSPQPQSPPAAKAPHAPNKAPTPPSPAPAPVPQTPPSPTPPSSTTNPPVPQPPQPDVQNTPASEKQQPAPQSRPYPKLSYRAEKEKQGAAKPPPATPDAPPAAHPGNSVNEGGPTPASMDALSAEYQAKWKLLATAAEDILAEDELGLVAWLNHITDRAAQLAKPKALVGPRGFASGSPEAGKKLLDPSTVNSPDRIPPDAVLEARRRRATKIALLEKPGPQPQEDEQPQAWV